MPVSGRLADMTAEGSSLRKSVSRGLSAHRRSLLGLSCSHRGIHLPCGRPTRRASRRDSDGVSVFRVVEIRPGWVLPLRRDGGVRTAGTASPTVTCRFSTANPVLRSRIPSPEGADNGAYGNSLHVHPSGLPQPVAPGWHRSPWALPRASHHPVTQVACRGGESVWTLARSQRRTPPSIPHPLRSLTSRDLTSHDCPQLHRPAATDGGGGLSPPLESISASWRTPRKLNPSPMWTTWVLAGDSRNPIGASTRATSSRSAWCSSREPCTKITKSSA